MIDREIALRDIERRMEDEGISGYMPFIRLRHFVREDFRKMRKQKTTSTTMRNFLLQMNDHIQQSYAVVPLGQQIHQLAEAISIGKLIEYEIKVRNVHHVNREPAGDPVSIK